MNATVPLTRERKLYLFQLGKAAVDCIHQKMGSVLRPSREHLEFASRQLDINVAEIKRALDFYNFGHLHDIENMSYKEWLCQGRSQEDLT